MPTTKYNWLLEAIEKGDTDEILDRVTSLLKDLDIYLVERPIFFTVSTNKHFGDRSIRVNLYYTNYYLVYKITPDDHSSVTLVQLEKAQEHNELFIIK